MIATTNTLDDLLFDSCEELQLPPSYHEAATKHYAAVATWLGIDGSELAEYEPQIYPQGSFLLGTTTRPIENEEFDLDFVLELNLDIGKSCPIALLDKVEERLKEHKAYRPMVQRLKRCVRLNYAGQFHMDILPAAPEAPPVGTRIQVPDRKLKDWKASDPKGFAKWFGERRVTELIEKAAEIEAVPVIQSVEEKTPLQRCVQLMKRARDKYFLEAKDMESSPRSIVLSKMAGEVYGGERSTAQALHHILGALVEGAQQSHTPPEICNPANPKEIFSEKWIKEPASYEKYRKWVFWLANVWGRVLNATSIDDAKVHLAELFGEELMEKSIRKHAGRMEKARRADRLRVSAAGVLSTATKGQVVRPNEFYGQE